MEHGLSPPDDGARSKICALSALRSFITSGFYSMHCVCVGEESRDGYPLTGGRGAVRHVRGRWTKEARATVREREAAAMLGVEGMNQKRK
jgi:hypothetical protein